jgi:hypothetical protein
MDRERQKCNEQPLSGDDGPSGSGGGNADSARGGGRGGGGEPRGGGQGSGKKPKESGTGRGRPFGSTVKKMAVTAHESAAQVCFV